MKYLMLLLIITGISFHGQGEDCIISGIKGGKDSSITEKDTLIYSYTYSYYNYTPKVFSETEVGKSIQSGLDNSLFFDSLGVQGVSMDKIRVWGNMRFLTIYRSMQDYYPDMITREKSFSFSDYPIVNAGPGNNGAIPLLELGMESHVSPSFDFNIGYSYAHTYQNTTVSNNDKIASSRSDLRFGGRFKQKNYSIEVNAGHIIWTRTSKFTMGQPIYRDNYFDRMPWDWHRVSYDRFTEYYDNLGGNVGPEGFGRSPVYGTVADINIKPAKLNIKGVYGRTNRNTIQANNVNHFPSITYVLRVQRGILSKIANGTVGFNYYYRRADTDKINNLPDNIRLTTFDFQLKRRGIAFSGEVGFGKITNPLSAGKTGAGFDAKVEIDESISKLPFSFEYYNIDINVVSLDGSILNSNMAVRDGGYANELVWDNMLYVNVAQEVDLIANNRWGGVFKTQKSFGRFKIELGMSASQEKENLYDTITFQHRVNAFSRSRFRPWFQAAGPYSRIKSSWMRTFETITITDEANGISTDYRKGFNTVEILLKYKTQLFGKSLILLNMNAVSTIQDHWTPVPVLSDKAFIRNYYSDITAAYAIGVKYMITGQAGIERALGNSRTNPSADAGKYIDQTGYNMSAGISYDFAKNGNLHLLQRWMYHTDKNFALDTFKGHETTIELKIFF